MRKARIKKDGNTTLGIVRRFFPDVESVQDAKSPLVIEVTKRDETTSQKRDYKECAMAIACKRTLHADGMIMARSTAYVIKDNKAVRYKVPTTVAREITSFDRGSGFAPGVYQLSKPSFSLREPRNEDTPKNKKTGTWTRHVTTGIRAVLHGKDAQA